MGVEFGALMHRLHSWRKCAKAFTSARSSRFLSEKSSTHAPKLCCTLCFSLFVHYFKRTLFLFFFIARCSWKYPEKRDKRISVVYAQQAQTWTVEPWTAVVASPVPCSTIYTIRYRCRLRGIVININSMPHHGDEGLWILRTSVCRSRTNETCNRFPSNRTLMRQCVALTSNRITKQSVQRSHISALDGFAHIGGPSRLSDLRVSLASECTPGWFTWRVRELYVLNIAGITGARMVHGRMGKVYRAYSNTITHRSCVDRFHQSIRREWARAHIKN